MAPPRLNHFIEHDAEALAIEALSFLASRPEDFGRFLALSGIEPHALRAAAADPAFLVGLLDFLLQDEALLVAFARDKGFDPAAIGIARRRLDGTPAGPET